MNCHERWKVTLESESKYSVGHYRLEHVVCKKRRGCWLVLSRFCAPKTVRLSLQSWETILLHVAWKSSRFCPQAELYLLTGNFNAIPSQPLRIYVFSTNGELRGCGHMAGTQGSTILVLSPYLVLIAPEGLLVALDVEGMIALIPF